MCMSGDGYWDFHSDVERRANKEHRCDECRRTIAKGERYRHSTGKWEGDIVTSKQCAHCRAAARWLLVVCDGWVYEAIEEDLREHVNGEESEVGSWALARLCAWMARDWKDRDGNIRPLDEVKAQVEKAIAAYNEREAAWIAGQVTA
jgi:hypothetical protein